MADISYDDLLSAVSGQPNENMMVHGNAIGADPFPKRAIGDMSNMATQASIPPWLLPILMALGFRGRGGHAPNTVAQSVNPSFTRHPLENYRVSDRPERVHGFNAWGPRAHSRIGNFTDRQELPTDVNWRIWRGEPTNIMLNNRPELPNLNNLNPRQYDAYRQAVSRGMDVYRAYEHVVRGGGEFRQSMPPRLQTEIGGLVRSHFGQDNRNMVTSRSFPGTQIRGQQGFNPNMREQSFSPALESLNRRYDALANRIVLTPANRTTEQSINLNEILRAVRGDKPEGQ